MQLPEYQANDIEKGVVFISTCSIRFSNLPGFNRPFLPVENRRFSVVSIFCKHAKRVETTSKSSLCSPSYQLSSTALECVHVFCSLGKIDFPELVTHTREKTFPRGGGGYFTMVPILVISWEEPILGRTG